MQKGQRAFIGKVCMDRNSPADYIETCADALAGTEAFIQVFLIKHLYRYFFIKACIRPRTHVHTHTRTHAEPHHTHTHTQARTHAHIRAHTHTHMRAHSKA